MSVCWPEEPHNSIDANILASSVQVEATITEIGIIHVSQTKVGSKAVLSEI
jgi:hypothetical protein